MFTITRAAAARIRQSALDSRAEGMALRVAARREADGSLSYGMGFDDAQEGEQPALQSDGVTVLIAPSSRALLQDTELDFVELDPGQFNFIFVPRPAAAGARACGSGGCSGGCSTGGGC